MSRICVKNLPRYLENDGLREHFSRIGEVTDAKIMKTKDGRSRQFGFVGYRTEEEAMAAVKYFNKTYIDTFKISCEVAYKIGASDIPRPWSRYSQKTQSEDGKEVNAKDGVQPKRERKEEFKENPVASVVKEKEDEPLFQEFLQVMQPRSKAKVWANDTVLGPSFTDINKGGQMSRHGKNVVQKVDDGILTKVTSKDKRLGVTFEDESSENSEEDESSENENGLIKMIADDSDNGKDNKIADIAKDNTVSDMDYFKSRIKQSWDSENESEKDGSRDSENENENNNSIRKHDEISSEVGLSMEEIANGNIFEEENNDSVLIKDPNKGSSNVIEPDARETNDIGNTAAKSSNETVDQGIDATVDSTHKLPIERNRLFIRNLPFTTSEEELVELFSKYGDILEVHVIVDKLSKRPKGYAYVHFRLPESAERACLELDNSIFQGRLLHIMLARKPEPVAEKNQTLSKSPEGMNTFKQKREEKKKESEAGGDTRAWNSFFMHPDTIAENVARKFKITKNELLNPEADDLAVRMALGETHIIAETKKALSEVGVNVQALEDLASGKLEKAKRSNHILLIKNLPFSTLEAELVQMFGRFGSLERIILPPTKTMALAVYLEAAEARAAFKGLAYKRYKHVPLYLEWAPEGILLSDFKRTYSLSEGQPVGVSLSVVTDQPEDADSDSDKMSASVFVKNLNFKTTASALRKHFEENVKDGLLRSVTMKSGDRPGRENRGFCFLEFNDAETARSVCKNLQGTVVDGHALSLQISQSRKTDTSKERKLDKQKCLTKIIVKNLAFEATKKDLRQLFSPFGQIKSLRIPKKADRNHRGFAFIEFVTKQEAENAFKALSNSHLYGRHLVLEQAQAGESLSDLRARIASKFVDDNDMITSQRPFKKRKSTQSTE